MRENDYQKLMKQIHVSETLEEQVLTMARRQETRVPRRKQSVWRVAVCAVLTMALVLTRRQRSTKTQLHYPEEHIMIG